MSSSKQQQQDPPFARKRLRSVTFDAPKGQDGVIQKMNPSSPLYNDEGTDVSFVIAPGQRSADASLNKSTNNNNNNNNSRRSSYADHIRKFSMTKNASGDFTNDNDDVSEGVSSFALKPASSDRKKSLALTEYDETSAASFALKPGSMNQSKNQKGDAAIDLTSYGGATSVGDEDDKSFAFAPSPSAPLKNKKMSPDASSVDQPSSQSIAFAHSRTAIFKKSGVMLKPMQPQQIAPAAGSPLTASDEPSVSSSAVVFASSKRAKEKLAELQRTEDAEEQKKKQEQEEQIQKQQQANKQAQSPRKSMTFFLPVDDDNDNQNDQNMNDHQHDQRRNSNNNDYNQNNVNSNNNDHNNNSSQRKLSNVSTNDNHQNGVAFEVSKMGASGMNMSYGMLQEEFQHKKQQRSSFAGQSKTSMRIEDDEDVNLTDDGLETDFNKRSVMAQQSSIPVQGIVDDEVTDDNVALDESPQQSSKSRSREPSLTVQAREEKSDEQQREEQGDETDDVFVDAVHSEHVEVEKEVDIIKQQPQQQSSHLAVDVPNTESQPKTGEETVVEEETTTNTTNLVVERSEFVEEEIQSDDKFFQSSTSEEKVQTNPSIDIVDPIPVQTQQQQQQQHEQPDETNNNINLDEQQNQPKAVEDKVEDQTSTSKVQNNAQMQPSEVKPLQAQNDSSSDKAVEPTPDHKVVTESDDHSEEEEREEEEIDEKQALERLRSIKAEQQQQQQQQQQESAKTNPTQSVDTHDLASKVVKTSKNYFASDKESMMISRKAARDVDRPKDSDSEYERMLQQSKEQETQDQTEIMQQREILREKKEKEEIEKKYEGIPIDEQDDVPQWILNGIERQKQLEIEEFERMELEQKEIFFKKARAGAENENLTQRVVSSSEKYADEPSVDDTPVEDADLQNNTEKQEATATPAVVEESSKSGEFYMEEEEDNDNNNAEEDKEKEAPKEIAANDEQADGADQKEVVTVEDDNNNNNNNNNEERTFRKASEDETLEIQRFIERHLYQERMATEESNRRVHEKYSKFDDGLFNAFFGAATSNKNDSSTYRHLPKGSFFSPKPPSTNHRSNQSHHHTSSKLDEPIFTCIYCGFEEYNSQEAVDKHIQSHIRRFSDIIFKSFKAGAVKIEEEFDFFSGWMRDEIAKVSGKVDYDRATRFSRQFRNTEPKTKMDKIPISVTHTTSTSRYHQTSRSTMRLPSIQPIDYDDEPQGGQQQQTSVTPQHESPLPRHQQQKQQQSHRHQHQSTYKSLSKESLCYDDGLTTAQPSRDISVSVAPLRHNNNSNDNSNIIKSNLPTISSSSASQNQVVPRYQRPSTAPSTTVGADFSQARTEERIRRHQLQLEAQLPSTSSSSVISHYSQTLSYDAATNDAATTSTPHRRIAQKPLVPLRPSTAGGYASSSSRSERDSIACIRNSARAMRDFVDRVLMPAEEREKEKFVQPQKTNWKEDEWLPKPSSARTKGF